MGICMRFPLLSNESAIRSAGDRTLFGVCLYTACSIAKACSLMVKDIYTNSGTVGSTINFRKPNTKGKLQTRTIPVIEDLLRLLTSWRSHAGETYLFPGRHPNHHCRHLHPDERGQDFEKSVLGSRHRGSIHPQLPSHRPLVRWATPELGCGLFKKWAVTATSNSCRAKKEVKPDRVKGAWASLSLLSYRGKYLFPALPFSDK